jgi:hypothetical protein
MKPLLERETIIRWDATGEPVVCWTADPRVKNDWLSYGFPVEKMGGGWQCRGAGRPDYEQTAATGSRTGAI